MIPERILRHILKTLQQLHVRPVVICGDEQQQQPIGNRLKPMNNEWLIRSKIAISEIAETLTSNLPIIENLLKEMCEREVYLHSVRKFFAKIGHERLQSKSTQISRENG